LIDQFIELETAIGYSFKDRRLLERALVHASANVSLQEVREGGRLSWLGDAILQMVVSETLFETHAEATREELHKMRERLTENTTIGRVGSSLGIEDAARIGASLEGNLEARDRHKMVAGILEGVLAAVYRDGGIDAARTVAQQILRKDLTEVAEQSALSRHGPREP
jgi:ribonuclease-3